MTVEIAAQPAKIDEAPLGAFLPYHNAACWVAYQSFNPQPTTGPKHITYILDDGSSQYEDATEQEAKYRMAQEQIRHAAGRGLIRVYGRIVDSYETDADLQDSKPSDLMLDGKVRLIHPEEFQKIMTSIDDSVVVGEIYYMEIAVDWNDLIKVFGPLALEFGHPLMTNERQIDRPAEDTAFSGHAKPVRGRPAKWDWNLINTEIVVLANSIDGLPKSQAELESWVAGKCQELFGMEPGVSTIRSKIAPIYSRLRQNSQ